VSSKPPLLRKSLLLLLLANRKLPPRDTLVFSRESILGRLMWRLEREREGGRE